jgi:hypothetical protein
LGSLEDWHQLKVELPLVGIWNLSNSILSFQSWVISRFISSLSSLIEDKLTLF